MLWALAVLGLLAGAYIYLRRGTLYIAHPFGYSGFSTGARPSSPEISQEDLPKLIDAMLAGEPFDWLHISHRSDGYGGFMLSREEGGVELSADWPTQPPIAEESEYRALMSEAGFQPSEDYLWNEGLGAALERRNVSYMLPPDQYLIMAITERLLDGPFTELDSPLYADGFRSVDGPGESGISFKVKHNSVNDVLGKKDEDRR